MIWPQSIRRFFKIPTPLEMAVAELTEAERSKLRSETHKEYAEADVAYHAARIKRLRAYVAANSQEQKP
jgi:hypothetical protein